MNYLFLSLIRIGESKFILIIKNPLLLVFLHTYINCLNGKLLSGKSDIISHNNLKNNFEKNYYN